MGPGDLGSSGQRRLIEAIRERGVDDLEVLELFDRVPRHRFLPEALRRRAYDDQALPIGHGQTASRPSLQAFYLALVQPGPGDRVLEVGTGSGFLTALLALRADRVFSVERVRALSLRARKALDEQGLTNAALLVGDGSIGWRKYAPFQVIVVSAASPRIPPALLDQLADPGRMLIPVGSRSEQKLVLVRKREGEVIREDAREACSFVPLLGRFGWEDEDRPPTMGPEEGGP